MSAPHVVVRPVLLALVLCDACHPSSVQKEASIRQPGTAELGSAGASAPGASISATVPHAPTLTRTTRATDSAELAPLAESGALVALEVTGFREAVVSVPLRTTTPKPIVLALHGNYDRPEWQCEVMREITDAFPFILCPRGIPRRDVPKAENRWEYGSVQQLRNEIEAGLSAMKTRFAGYVAEGPIVFTGFSLGAILGRPIVASEPERFPRVVFTEGGGEGWNFKQFKQGGGLRVVFGCAQRGCPESRRNVVRKAAAVGLEVRIADGGNIGHTYDGPVAKAIRAEWAWLVEGDSRWQCESTEH